MTSYPELFRPGKKLQLGSHTFAADEIIRFASKFDPQPFHVDAEAARKSVFGALCASGWHTLSVWMKLLRGQTDRILKENPSRSGGYNFRFGPSPGFDNLKWHKPVFAGDTISYQNEVISIRPSASRPPWHIMQVATSGTNQHGDMVISFESTVLIAFE